MTKMGHPPIIHISGASGSGKTTLGKKIAETFKSKVVVVDTDKLRDDWANATHYKDKTIAQHASSLHYKHHLRADNRAMAKFIEKSYQLYLDKYIESIDKVLVIVGLNDNTYGDNVSFYYDLHAENKYFIKISDKQIQKQRWKRMFEDIGNHNHNIDLSLYRWNANKQAFIASLKDAIDKECDMGTITRDHARWLHEYIHAGYELLPSDEIYKRVTKLINIIE